MEVVELVIKIPANTVTKKVTDYLNVDIDYSYRGPAQRISFTAVVTQSTYWGEFDEIGSTRKAVYVDVPEGYQTYQVRVPSLPLSGVEPKTTPYGVKIKAEGTFGTIEAGNKACLYVEEEAPPPPPPTITFSVMLTGIYAEQWYVIWDGREYGKWTSAIRSIRLSGVEPQGAMTAVIQTAVTTWRFTTPRYTLTDGKMYEFDAENIILKEAF